MTDNDWSDEFGDELAARVIVDGLPTPPPTITPGMSVPVARWIGRDVAAVLSVEWMFQDDDPEYEDYLCSEVRPFVPAVGGWEPTGGAGGGGWFDPPFARPALGPTELCAGGVHGEWSDDDSLAAVWGVVGPLVDRIEVRHGGTSTTRPVESPIGAIVAAVRGPGPADLVAYLADGTETGRYSFAAPTPE